MIAWILIGLFTALLGEPLVRGDSSLLRGVDHQAKLFLTFPTPVAYTLTTSPWFERRADSQGGCNFWILARVQGGAQTRLILGAGTIVPWRGKEQLVGDNWAARSRIKGGETVRLEGWFLDPIGGATLAHRKATFHCRKSHVSSNAYVQPDMSGVR